METDIEPQQNCSPTLRNVQSIYAYRLAQMCDRLTGRYSSPQNDYGRVIRDIGYDYNASTGRNLALAPKVERLASLRILERQDFDEIAELVKRSEKMQVMIGIFGESLSVKGEFNDFIFSYLEDMTLLPEKHVKGLVKKGLKVVMGLVDMLNLPNDEGDRKYYAKNRPKGLNRENWKGLPGAYDPLRKTAYAGIGVPVVCASIVLHEIGHAYGDLFGLDSNLSVKLHHRRLYDHLREYERKGGPDGSAGIEEFLAESIGVLHKSGKSELDRRYDSKWRNELERILNRLRC